jgi:hypothetical protein
VKEENQIMKLKLATLVVASAVALSSTSVSARVYKPTLHRNPYNAMNMMQDPAPGPSGYWYGPGYSYGQTESPGSSNLSGTGSSQFGGSGDGGGGGAGVGG